MIVGGSSTYHHNTVIFPALLELSDSQTLKLNPVNVFVLLLKSLHDCDDCTRQFSVFIFCIIAKSLVFNVQLGIINRKNNRRDAQ